MQIHHASSDQGVWWSRVSPKMTRQGYRKESLGIPVRNSQASTRQSVHVTHTENIFRAQRLYLIRGSTWSMGRQRHQENGLERGEAKTTVTVSVTLSSALTVCDAHANKTTAMRRGDPTIFAILSA